MVIEIIGDQIFNIYENLKCETVAISVEDVDSYIEETKEIRKEKDSEEKELVQTKEEVWQIEIPKINLIAPISEGTSQEVMLEYVGHFEGTSQWEGNIGLAAHNRGYPINYFSKLKELRRGDKIIYKSKYGTKMYSVNFIKIIEDTNWSYLEKTNQNKITLITCVENKPSQRLCIQGIEIKEE